MKTATLWRFSNVESIGYGKKPPRRGGFDLFTAIIDLIGYAAPWMQMDFQ
jgi:hypothetical protein